MARKMKHAVGSAGGNTHVGKISSPEEIVRSRDFKLGFADKRAGLPLRETQDMKYPWRYERGRMFAVIYSGPLMEGRKVAPGVAAKFYQAAKEGTII